MQTISTTSPHISQEALKMPREKKRIAWVDYAKAIAILAIIVGHVAPWFSGVLSWGHPLCELMYSFHVAAFFLLSGYTTKPGIMNGKKLLAFTKNCFVPYILAGILSIVVCMLFTPEKSIIEWVSAFIYGSGLYNGPIIWGYPFGALTIGAIWFLPALFFGKFFATLMSRFPIIVRIILSAVLFFIGFETAKICFLPMDIQQGMCATWWITCGMILAQTGILQSKKPLWTVMIIVVALIGLCYMGILWMEIWHEPTYCNSLYPNGIFDMLGTTCATITIICIAKLIEHLPSVIRSFFSWTGKNTLALFCWHAIAIAPGGFLSAWILSFIFEGGWSPALVFWGALVAELLLAFGLTALSSILPGLRSVFFPYKKKEQRRNKDAKNKSAINQTLTQHEHNSVSYIHAELNRTTPVSSNTQVQTQAQGQVHHQQRNLTIKPPTVDTVKIHNDVVNTKGSAEDVILAAKRKAGYKTPAVGTRRHSRARRTNLNIEQANKKNRSNPGRYLDDK